MYREYKKTTRQFFQKTHERSGRCPAFFKGFFASIDFQEARLRLLKSHRYRKTGRKYKKFYLDLSVECRLSGSESEIYIVFEHKSYPDKLTLIQVLNYCAVVWETNIRNKEPLRPIIPVVFYHGKQKFNLPTDFSDYFDVDDIIREYLVDFSVVLFDTNQHTDDDILKSSGDLYLAASLLAMKHIFKDFN